MSVKNIVTGILAELPAVSTKEEISKEIEFVLSKLTEKQIIDLNNKVNRCRMFEALKKKKKTEKAARSVMVQKLSRKGSGNLSRVAVYNACGIC